MPFISSPPSHTSPFDKMRFKLSILAPLLSFALVAVAEAKKHHHKHGHHKQHPHVSPEVDTRAHHGGHIAGIPWGCSNDCLKGLESTRRSSLLWYHHWQDTCVPDLDQIGLEYVPTFWGPTKWDKWNAVKAEIYKKPTKYLLAFNEPDVQSPQSNMGPKAAARLWMQELKPFADKGVQVGSPQVCWNMQWLEQFMDECKKLGCNISFIALHWYGSWKDFDKFIKWISTVYHEFNLPIWVTEYGITQASGGSQQDIKDFHVKAVQWMRQQGYVHRSAWLGGFPINKKPDPYPASFNSYFNGDGSARDLLRWASHSAGDSFINLPTGISKRDLEDELKNKTYKDDEVTKEHYEQYDEEHCDYKCQLRENSLEKHHRKKKGIVQVDDKQVCVATPSKLDREERKKLTSCFKEAGLLGAGHHHRKVAEGHAHVEASKHHEKIPLEQHS